jgi:transcriptional regulator with XRE-family HTH domain
MPRPNPIRGIAGERGLTRRIAYERELREWSPAGLAQRMTEVGCPINQSAIWKIEHNTPPRRITYDEALAFAQVFDIPLDELSVPPELIANEQLRAWIEERAGIEAERARLGGRSEVLLGQIRRLLSQFPDAERVIEELFPPEDPDGPARPEIDLFTGKA